MSSTSSMPQAEQARTKSQRVLACVNCQQRKVKCERKFPCAHCTKVGVRCVPGALLQRQRRRRFPERELLDRLRQYEAILRKNNIEFEPLHAQESPLATGGNDRDVSDNLPHGREDTEALSKGTVKVETVYRPKSTSPHRTTLAVANDTQERLASHEAERPDDGYEDDEEDDDDDDDDNEHGNLSSKSLDDEESSMHEALVHKAMDQSYQSNDHLLFGSPTTNMALAALHPPQVQIFRLWQFYLDNVNPLLKVTHIPTLQTRFLDAAADVENISPILEALMFSIYCITILTLEEEQCTKIFGSPKQQLLATYQSACQQALQSCGFLRTFDTDCLTAFFLYLLSARDNTDPRSISSLLGVAIRIAQRIGINNNAMYTRCNPLEAEMRRRLWWALVIFDARICEQSNWRASALNPSWDCSLPLNVSDFDLRPDMENSPLPNDRPTEALFAVVRSKIAEYIRHSGPHLDFTNPSLKAIAKSANGSDPITSLEKELEEHQLQFCNPENPLHYMTLWMTRYNLAQMRLLEYYSRISGAPSQQTDADRNAAFDAALAMLECGAKLLNSSLIKNYLWLTQMYFPFLAYMHLMRDLRKRPYLELAARAWSAINNDYETRRRLLKVEETPLLNLFSKTILAAWEAREAAVRSMGRPPESLSPMLEDARRRLTNMRIGSREEEMPQLNQATEKANTTDLPNVVPMDMNFGLPFDLDLDINNMGTTQYGSMTDTAGMDVNLSDFDWTTIDWNSVESQGW